MADLIRPSVLLGPEPEPDNWSCSQSRENLKMLNAVVIDKPYKATDTMSKSTKTKLNMSVKILQQTESSASRGSNEHSFKSNNSLNK